ncbi:VanZ family protein [Saccharothrix australiensis]|uniref:VanZ like protein n=1 Tax=Saccharothrix australiensis TaxID=2072 RepID=A0A495VSQ1_9PSEU|nr:VanZ family protein [Saccharothrix australiensis]RKT52264.1 VanZ like protein [Saccharothrix australiensis]
MSARQDAYIAELVLSRPGVVAAMLFGCVVLGALALALARWRGWRPLPATLAGCGLALALAVTLARPGVLDADVWTTEPVGTCIANDFSLTGSLERLNLVMLVPFAFFATLATRRPLVVAALSAAVSGTVEFVQVMTGLGVCEAQDFYNNTVGAVGGALVAWLITVVGGDRPGGGGGGGRGGGRRDAGQRGVGRLDREMVVSR